ncbi:hypothetical protein Tco_1517338 [Tanacetum coccineum]
MLLLRGDKEQGKVDSQTVTTGTPEPHEEKPRLDHTLKITCDLAGPNPRAHGMMNVPSPTTKSHPKVSLKPAAHNGTNGVIDENQKIILFYVFQENSRLTLVNFVGSISIKTNQQKMIKATTITTSLLEITPFIALQLRVARLEQEMTEVKKTDHSADVLASIKSQVPTTVDKYLGTKLDDALLKVLERHTADLIKKYSVLPGPESIQNQESKKSPKEIIRIKGIESLMEKQDLTYSIRSTDKVDLE